jgi:hypothetical protein
VTADPEHTPAENRTGRLVRELEETQRQLTASALLTVAAQQRLRVLAVAIAVIALVEAVLAAALVRLWLR